MANRAVFHICYALVIACLAVGVSGSWFKRKNSISIYANFIISTKEIILDQQIQLLRLVWIGMVFLQTILHFFAMNQAIAQLITLMRAGSIGFL